MTKIQEKVEHYVEDWLDTSIERRVFYALLREFMEECCRPICTMCDSGPAEKKGTKYVHIADGREYQCAAYYIRCHFAWLDGK